MSLYDASAADWSDYEQGLTSFAALGYGEGWTATLTRGGRAGAGAGGRGVGELSRGVGDAGGAGAELPRG